MTMKIILFGDMTSCTLVRDYWWVSSSGLWHRVVWYMITSKCHLMGYDICSLVCDYHVSEQPAFSMFMAETKTLKIHVSRDVVSCQLVNSYQHFGGMYCLHLQGPSISWTIYQSTWCKITEHLLLQQHYCENLQSHHKTVN